VEGPARRIALLVALLAALVVLPAAEAASKHPSGAARSAVTVVLTSSPRTPTTSTSATFAWQSNGATNVQCRLDGRPFVSCRSPATFRDLSRGTHRFAVRVTRLRATATARATWTIKAPPTTAPSTGSASTSPSAIAPSQPPSSYPLPAGAIVVTSSAELVTALASSQPSDIVLADGVYGTDGSFWNTAGHRLYAQRLGGAVLTSGLVIGSNSGAGGGVVRGIVFDVSDPNKAFGGGIVHIWGAGGRNTKVLDSVFWGNRLIPVGVLAYNPDGLAVQRLQFREFTHEGLRASDNTHVAYGTPTPRIAVVSDIDVDGVAHTPLGSSDGRAEAGIWIGHPVVNGVRRIKIRNVSWSGIWVGNNSWNTTYEDLDIDMSGANEYLGVAVYLEHFSYGNTFQRFHLRARFGFSAEWSDPALGGIAAAHFSTIQNGTIEAVTRKPGRSAGVYLDEGTEATTVTSIRFRNQNWAAIGAYKTVGVNRFQDNDYSGLAPGAVAISNEHI
jgi:hypothetical protein